MSEGKPWLANYGKYDYRRVWERKRLEDLAQKHIIEGWLPPDGRCLELGGGFGRITKILQPRFKDTLAIEYVLRNLEVAKRRLAKAHLARADILRIPARDSVFDCVVMIRVIHLLPDPVGVMREVVRVAKNGSTVVVSMPNLPINSLFWAARSFRTRDPAIGPFVWPFGRSHRFIRPAHISPPSLKLESRRGTGLFDNPLGRLLDRFAPLYLLDVATSALWFGKLDIFMKFRVEK